MIGRQTRFDLRGEQFVRLLKHLEEKCHCRYFFSSPELRPGKERFFSSTEYKALKPTENCNVYAVSKIEEARIVYKKIGQRYMIDLNISHIIEMFESQNDFMMGRLYFIPTFISNKDEECRKAEDFLEFCDQMFNFTRTFVRKEKR